MEHKLHPNFSAPVPGVRPTDQKRSQILQSKFVAAGRKVLLDTRLTELSIPVLAKQSKSSVGGFYSRFESKEAFFELLRIQMLSEHLKLYDTHLDPSHFEGKSRHDVTVAFVDVMLIVFNGPWRGVLRECYFAIPERPDNWAPMKERGRLVRAKIIELYQSRVEKTDGLEERVSFAVQLLFSALNNELMNPNLVFSIKDPRFRSYLIETFDRLVEGA